MNLRLNSRLVRFALALWCCSGAVIAQTYNGIGRQATPAEIKAWDIDVRADFKGLPKGQGSVARGESVWETQCASCHGSFGESNEVFTPIVGGVTKKDIETGRVAALMPGANNPQRSTFQKVASLSTIWDYINRAMPWNAPKSLSTDDVYAVTAYILNLSGIVSNDFVLSDKNIAQVQQRMPNRNGITHAHAMWPDPQKTRYFKDMTDKPDVQGTICMKNCTVSGQITSALPDYARDAHGNVSAQMRPLGAVRGVDTSKPPLHAGEKWASQSASTRVAGAGLSNPSNPPAALAQNGCTSCHGMQSKLVGPSFGEIAKKYASRTDGRTYLIGKIKSGGSGVWGPVAMPAQSISASDAEQVVRWLMTEAVKF
jgi:S-disulfanyl-L-cysteine oxidoreductase SoxD